MPYFRVQFETVEEDEMVVKAKTAAEAEFKVSQSTDGGVFNALIERITKKEYDDPCMYYARLEDE